TTVLEAVAHEFFHGWNVERIRPKALEPFNLDEPTSAGQLWFAEGFTSYYESLIMARAGLANPGDFALALGASLDTVANSPARRYRSAEDMSRMAPFVD